MAYMQFIGPNFYTQIPTNWLITSSVSHQAMFLGPENEKKQRATIVVALSQVAQNVTANGVASIARTQQEEQCPEYQVISETDFGGNGEIKFFRQMKWLHTGTQTRIMQRQLFFVRNGILYTITASRPDGAEFAAAEDIFDHFMTNFHFTDAAPTPAEPTAQQA